MLVRAPDGHRKTDTDRGAILYWMTNEGEEPPRLVRVYVSCGALEEIDPDQRHALDWWSTTFDNNRDRIDIAANSKFDAGQVEPDLEDGYRVIVVCIENLIRVDDVKKSPKLAE
jgi:hypothetical protein